jgi:hypothetical protein
MMTIRRENNKFIIEIEDTAYRSNPYDNKFCEPMDSCVGLISNYAGYDEFGLAHRIDMDYKDKPDQVGSYVVYWQSDEQSFRDMCKNINVDIMDYRKETTI